MERLRIGIIGLGAVVRALYQHLYFRSRYSGLISVEAVCDPSAESMAWFTKAYDVPADRRFADHRRMIEAVELDAIAVNTPDCLHREPVVDALRAGLDVIVAKPLADRVADAHAMIRAVRQTGRFLGVDFHKRHDPRIREAGARLARGEYGRFQLAVLYMLDRLQVADPNHRPRFFADARYAERNTPVSFLTVHLADALVTMTGLTPAAVRATGWKHKLPSLRPVAVDGYDLVDTEVRFAGGGAAHLITGWHLPNTAYAGTVQSGRIVCTDGLLDLALDRSGYHEIVPGGVFERNSLLMGHEPDGTSAGYGIDSPGEILRTILADRRGELPADTRARLLAPRALGFDSTLICQAAHESLAAADGADGVFAGPTIDVKELLDRELGSSDAQAYL